MHYPSAVLGALLLAGCAHHVEAPDCHGIYHFHRSFPTAYRAAVVEGVTRWNAVDGVREQVSIAPGDDDDSVCSFREIPADGDEYEQIKAEHGGDFMAYALGRDGSVIVTKGPWMQGCIQNLGEDCVIGATMHELGHHKGMQHTENASVMNPRTIVTRFTEIDMAECRRVGSCTQS